MCQYTGHFKFVGLCLVNRGMDQESKQTKNKHNKISCILPIITPIPFLCNVSWDKVNIPANEIKWFVWKFFPYWPRPGSHKLGLYSLRSMTCYRQISWNVGAAKLGVKMITSLRYLTGYLEALQLRWLSNFRAFQKSKPKYRGFEVLRKTTNRIIMTLRSHKQTTDPRVEGRVLLAYIN